MRIGIAILQDGPWARAGERWRRAEAYGFDHGWVYDHLGWGPLVDHPWFDAVPTLAAAATVTSRMRFGTFVASPNFRHPVAFAREVTTLDDISGGRLLLGVGAGGLSGYDASVIGAPPLSARARVDRFAEFLELLDLLLRADGVSWSGEYYTAVDARNNPGCVQSPRVPFVVAANGPRAMGLAARYGHGWATTGAGGEDQEAWWRRLGELVRRFEDALAANGHAPGDLDRYLQLDAGPVYSLSGADAFADAVGRAGELGFTDVVTHWPRPAGPYAGDEAVLEEVAATVLARRAATGRSL
jgi:alkanesulfonate monooxygenase SsuD/methylene tetrahydromethanopterin reductase-like flavin-dependent oxidoreductase (luciferase family)